MDEYAFLIELNSNLGFKFAGNAIAGDIGDLSFKISFAMNNSLKVHTKAYLDSSYPTEEPVPTETARELDPPGANVEKTPEYYRDFIIMFSFLGFCIYFPCIKLPLCKVYGGGFHESYDQLILLKGEC